jgi:hypothetical protein
MPFIQAHIAAGLTHAQKRQLIHEIVAVLIEPDDVKWYLTGQDAATVLRWHRSRDRSADARHWHAGARHQPAWPDR